MVEMAGVYGGALELTCILNEAVITVSGTALVENGKLGKNTYALGSQINEGDFVSLDVTAANTYDATGGLPVVTLPTAANGIIGIVKSQPVFNKVPASTTGVWAGARLTAGDYRVATVVFPLMTMAVKALSDGDGTASKLFLADFILESLNIKIKRRLKYTLVNALILNTLFISLG